jgi:hypothetical protein
VIESPSAATTMRPLGSSGIGLLRDPLRGASVLLDDVVALSPLDHALHVGDLMTRIHREAVRLGTDVLVLGLGHGDALRTVGIATLANEIEDLGLEVKRVGQYVYALIDLSKDGLVQSDALFR